MLYLDQLKRKWRWLKPNQRMTTPPTIIQTMIWEIGTKMIQPILHHTPQLITDSALTTMTMVATFQQTLMETPRIGNILTIILGLRSHTATNTHGPLNHTVMSIHGQAIQPTPIPLQPITGMDPIKMTEETGIILTTTPGHQNLTAMNTHGPPSHTATNTHGMVETVELTPDPT